MRWPRIFVALAALVAVTAPSIVQAAQLGTSLEIPDITKYTSGTGGSAPSFAQPFNHLVIPGPGDSRTALGGGAAMGVYGVTGTGITDSTVGSGGTSVDGWLAQALGNKVRMGTQVIAPSSSAAINQGIGGQFTTQALAWPRLAGLTNSVSTGSIIGTTWTVTTKNTTQEDIKVGQIITCTGCSAGTKVVSFGTGTGKTGTYNITPSQTVTSTATFLQYWTDTKTIAETAANPAGIVTMWLGTNSAGVWANDLAAYDAAIRSLTIPGTPYPGYRPNDEATDQPLPLYNGLPKVLWIFNETRRGVTTLNASNQLAGDPSGFANYAATMKRYDWNSGVVGYANPNVWVADTFNDPVLANLADTTNYTPNGGFFADGLHEASTAVVRMTTVMASRVSPMVSAWSSFEHLLDTTNATANSLTQNPLFQTHTAGTGNTGSNTISLDGTPTTIALAGPSKWQLNASAASGLNFDFHYDTLAGTAGDQVVIHITGTPSGNIKANLTGTASSTQLSSFNLATDTLRLACRVSLTIVSGSVYTATAQATLTNADAAHAYINEIGLNGNPAGYANTAAYPMLLNTCCGVDVSFPSYVTYSGKNVSLAQYGATGNPSSIQTVVRLGLLGGVATDVTLTLSQCGSQKVTD